MRYSVILLLLLSLVMTDSLWSQTVKGRVLGRTDSRIDTLAGASVLYTGTTVGTVTDHRGEFTLPSLPSGAKHITASYMGFRSDTVNVESQFITIILNSSATRTAEFEVTGKREGTTFDNASTMKVESLTGEEFAKAACCDLSGCFETQASVQPQVTNIITNSKELRILGLSGVYNQVLLDGLPMMQGLAYTYGVSSIPGTLVKAIHIAKGANSVVQGAESITGQLSIDLVEPEHLDHAFVNLYMNSFQEKQANLNYATAFGGEGVWRGLTALHTVQPGMRADRDQDDFLDLPLTERYMAYQRFEFLGSQGDSPLSARLSLRYVDETRTGGQEGFDVDRDKGGIRKYGQYVHYTQPEAILRGIWRFDECNALSLLTAIQRHDQEANFGTTEYRGEQTMTTVQMFMDTETFGEQRFKIGAGIRDLRVDERLRQTNASTPRQLPSTLETRDMIVGGFMEQQLAFEPVTLVAGLRGDYHREHGWFASPRFLVKAELTPSTLIRGSFGSGAHTVQVFSENVNILASARNIIIEEDLELEKAVNWGVNLVQHFSALGVTGTLTVDFYRTQFSNQISPDYDRDPSSVVIANFHGTSISNGAQAELQLSFLEAFDFKMAYNWLDVYQEKEGGRQELPFNARHKMLGSLSWQPTTQPWRVDLNAHWYGPQRLPDTRSLPAEYQQPSQSPSYALLNGQVTWLIEGLELFAGCENILDYRQERPILSWQDPFSPYFDTSFAWGPTRGREVYAGLRYRLDGLWDSHEDH